jgi:hypothetical protein
MSMIFKTIVAFCVGLGALTAVQSLWVSSIIGQVRSEMARSSAALPQTQIMPTVKVDADRLRQAIMPTMGHIDTTAGQRLAIESAARRVDIQIRNAQSAVPAPRSFPGMPRY